MKKVNVASLLLATLVPSLALAAPVEDNVFDDAVGRLDRTISELNVNKLEVADFEAFTDTSGDIITALSNEVDARFEATAKVLEGLAKKGEETDKKFEATAKVLEGLANRAQAVEVEFKNYVDGYIGTVIDDYDGFIGNIHTDLDNLEARMDTLDPNKVEKMVGAADSRLAGAESDIEELQDAVENNELNIADNTIAIADNKEEADAKFAAVDADVEELQDAVENNELNIAHNTIAIEENENAIAETLSVVGALAQGTDTRFAQVGDSIRALNKSVAQNTARLDNLDRRVDKLNEDLKRGLATQSALAGLFQPYNVGKVNVTAALGGYQSKAALAVGTGYRFNENLAVKAGVAVNLGKAKGVAYNVGINYEF